jgi:hypothetical protein
MSEFYALQFVSTGFNKNVTVRAVRNKPYSSFEKAKHSLLKVGEGYIKEGHNPIPVWNNTTSLC